MVEKLDQAWRFLGHGLHVLTAVLVLITGFKDGWGLPLAVFAVVYVAGMVVRSARWWLLIVVLTWVGLLITSPTASFLAFPLFFLCIGILPMAWAVPAVIAITAAAVYALGRFNGWTVGGVIGPVTGAMVAIALGVGFRMLRRETAAAERMRLAGEIHDTVAQGLSSIHMLMHSVDARLAELEIADNDKQELRRQVALARQTAETNLEDTRRIIASLQPQQLENSDFQAAVREVVANTPLGENFHCEVDGAPYPLGTDVHRELLRIIQSLVSNVVKHAEATTARVTVTYHPDSIAVDVVDNGRGMDVEQTQWSSVGIEGVQRRAARLGGSVAVESEPGAGCGVSVHLPRHKQGAKQSGHQGDLWSE